MMKSTSDSGRAPSGAITADRRLDRTTDELVGLCRGLLADGHVSQQEAEFLKRWIERNAEFAERYPLNRIYAQLATILEDGFIDADESADLHETLVRFVGGEVDAVDEGIASLPTSLPLCVPVPSIEFADRTFVVTGTFTYGTRSSVHAALSDRGARTTASVSRKIDYLVIGDLGSRDWINSNAGRKIQAAVELRDAGHPLAIVSEVHWRTSL